MTKRNSLKRRVRGRMSRTGESYATARKMLLDGDMSAHEVPAAASLSVVLAQPAMRTGDLDVDLANLFDNVAVPRCDVLVLPELIGNQAQPAHYRKAIKRLAAAHNCFVVGGSCYVSGPAGRINAGIVVDSAGREVCSYEKIRPYGSENELGVSAGSSVGQFEIEGRVIAVLICSDLWFSATFAALESEPDVLLIPSFSITQRGDPRKARDLWQHMLVSRAYEYSAYVGVCDWAHPCEFEGLLAAGVSGFADPRPSADAFFTGNLEQKIQSYQLDFARLDSFRENRADRGFHHGLAKWQ